MSGKICDYHYREVAAVDSALSKGKEIGEGCVVDELFIPNLHPQIIPAIGTVECEIWDAIAMVESFQLRLVSVRLTPLLKLLIF